MIRPRKRKDGSKSYGVRVHRGQGRFEWVGTFPTLKEARAAERKALDSPRAAKLTFGELAEAFLAEAERTKRIATVQRSRYAIEAFKAEDFEHALVDQVTRADAERFAQKKEWAAQEMTTVFGYAVDHGYIDRSPFRALTSKKSVGRRDLDPLTPEEVEGFATAAAQVHEHYPYLAALIRFGAYTGLRPGELFALEWRDLDLDNSRVRVRRSMSGTRVGPTKTGEQRTSVILPEGRDALLGLPREHDYVFPAKRGGRLSGPQASLYYLPTACVAFGKKVTLHELRHFCAHHMYVRMDLPARTVAVQLGHSSPRLVEDLYGHAKVGALEEIERAVGQRVRNLRAVGE